jgi:hypothetical protein
MVTVWAVRSTPLLHQHRFSTKYRQTYDVNQHFGADIRFGNARTSELGRRNGVLAIDLITLSKVSRHTHSSAGDHRRPPTKTVSNLRFWHDDEVVRRLQPIRDGGGGLPLKSKMDSQSELVQILFEWQGSGLFQCLQERASEVGIKR